MNSSALNKLIDQIKNNDAGEPDLYSYVKDLLTKPTLGLNLQPSQVVVDSRIDDSLRRPDLVAYKTINGTAQRRPDYAFAVFEVKPGSKVRDNPSAVFSLKKGYIQAGTRWFFLIDQTFVRRVDCLDRLKFVTTDWSWDDLRDEKDFSDCFCVISSDALMLETDLLDFIDGKTPFSYLRAEGDARASFAETVHEASRLLRESVDVIVTQQVLADTQSANLMISKMESVYGSPVFYFSDPRRPIEFSKLMNDTEYNLLSDDDIVSYESNLSALLEEIQSVFYAVRIDRELIPQYAARQGIDTTISITDLNSSSSERKEIAKKLVSSLVYETASLMLSRMLMIRFCEDHGLFTKRYISNGGISIFWNFARHFSRPMQDLIRITYEASSEIFRSLFDRNSLDWALDRGDAPISDALQRASFILSKWDFKTVHGDILSGVYDKYLDVSQRRRLGEVYTRPEIASYMLSASSWKPSDTVLDPACGTGTFLVEALSQRLKSLKASGATSDVTVSGVVGKLHGLDISNFSVALAQIQIFWHLVELMSDKSADEARTFAKAIIPSMQFYGGWSSLDPMGMAFEATGMASQAGLGFRVRSADGRSAGSFIPAGFERVARAEYDLVIMNPPYVRSERQGAADYSVSYREVVHRGTDLSAFFVYRALRHWVKPGGTLAFIVPIGLLEAEYGGPLRRVLSEYRVVEIADLEGLGKTTFRGIKRPTVIVTVRKEVPSHDDDILIRQLDTSCINDDDTIDFSKARTSTVRRAEIDRSYYLPPESSMSPWLSAIRGGDEDTSAILTKLSSDEVSALSLFKGLPRLGSIIKLVWARRSPSSGLELAEEVPAGSVKARWNPELVFNYGVKLGGKRALETGESSSFLSIFKGQNIFPGGVLGNPMGKWDPAARKEQTRYIYSYNKFFKDAGLFAIREISQLPTACAISRDIGFQNTAYVLQLEEDFPLDIFLLSRVIQFYAARVLRSSIIEDYGCHWYKRTIPFLPIPTSRSDDEITALKEAGQWVLSVDADLANKYRRVDEIIDKSGTISLNQLIIDGKDLALGIDLSLCSETPSPIKDISEVDDQIVSNDLFMRLTIPNERLRRYVAFEISRRIERDPDLRLGRDDIVAMKIPVEINSAIDEITEIRSSNIRLRYESALLNLDVLVADQCKISDKSRDFMIDQMKSDPILRKMSPMTRQRGLHVQAYADHSDSDRYG